MALTDEAQAFLTQVAQTIAGEVPDVLGMAISKTMTVVPGDVAEADPATITGATAAPLVQVQFGVTENTEDVVQLYFPAALGINIAQWMMGEEGAESVTDAHLDALREAANMILGSLATAYSDTLGRSIEFYSIRAEVIEEAGDVGFDFADPVMAPFTLSFEGEDDQPVYLVTAADTLTHFQEGAVASESTDEDMADEMDGDDVGAMEGLADTEDAAPGADMGGMGMMSAPMAEDEDVVLEIPGVEPEKVEMLMDLSLPVTIELGRTRMLIKDVLELGHGSVVEFDKLAGEPVDLLINDKKIAEGEVVVIDEHFGIRLTSLIRPSERIKNLGK